MRFPFLYRAIGFVRSIGIGAVLLHAASAGAAPGRIADLWYAHNAMSVMLGAGDKIVVTVDSGAAEPWLYLFAPNLRHATVVAAGPANAETLAAAHVDMVFVANMADAARLTKMGVPARGLRFTDLASLRASVQGTADALGTQLAQTRAHDYNRYLDDVFTRLNRGLAGLAPDHRPRVLHIGSTMPLRVDGEGTIMDEWIRLAGGRNAAVGIHGSLQPVSAEQIAQWNPDIIIIGGQAELPDRNPQATLPFLHGRRFVRNPTGAYQWDRYSPEFALQVQWVAKLLHPERFARLDLTRETMAFYRRFFNYPLSADQARRMLDGQPPAFSR